MRREQCLRAAHIDKMPAIVNGTLRPLWQSGDIVNVIILWLLMKKRYSAKPPPSLTVDYSLLGIITIEELMQAILTDLHVLEDVHHVKYIKAPKLRFEITNEFGEVAPLKSLGDGKPIYRMHTRHFRPACQDYEP